MVAVAGVPQIVGLAPSTRAISLPTGCHEQADVDQDRTRCELTEVLRSRQPRERQVETEGQDLLEHVEPAGERRAADYGAFQALRDIGVVATLGWVVRAFHRLLSRVWEGRG